MAGKKTGKRTEADFGSNERLTFSVLEEKIKTGSIPIDLGGHNKRQKEIDRRGSFLLRSDRREKLSRRRLIALAKAVAGGPALATPVHLYRSCLFRCYQCGQDIGLQTDGRSVTCYNPCPHPDGFPPMVVELNVPSGRMAVGNDFRDLFRVIGDYDIGTLAGMAKTMAAYAAAGMAHGFVGNSCPGFWRLRSDKKKFAIGCGVWKKGDDYLDEQLPVARNSVRVGGVSTSLWWYSVADHAEFLKRAGKRAEDYDVDVVECLPGVYRFTHVTHLIDRDDGTRPQVMARVEWVRKPDPPVDYDAHYRSLDLTAGQVLLDAVRRYPTLFLKDGEAGAASLASAAGQVLLVSGSGYELHPNGWLGSNPDLDNDSERVAVPVFDAPYHWYDIDQYSFLVNAAGQGENLWDRGGRLPEYYLNESFTELAFNVLQCIVRHGVDGTANRHVDPDGRRAAESWRWARIALKGLAARYPDRIPEFARPALATLGRIHIKPVTPAEKKGFP